MKKFIIGILVGLGVLAVVNYKAQIRGYFAYKFSHLIENTLEILFEELDKAESYYQPERPQRGYPKGTNA